MIRIWIDNQEVVVSEGSTLLEAAGKLGVVIPTLCFLGGCSPSTSCFVCVVKVEGREHFVPSCATVAQDGMRVFSECDEVREARKAALELLLSDHVGDCMGPCHSICPAKMDIPRMIRQIAAGQLAQAIATVKADIPLPAILGRICPAPCEKGCRRGQHDAPVSICLLKRHVADVDLASGRPYLPQRRASTDKKVAIVGAGPAGLSAAYYLLTEGHSCTVFDEHPQVGGGLRYGVTSDKLSPDVIDAETGVIGRIGATFRLGQRVGDKESLERLRREFDAVLIAGGTMTADQVGALGLQAGQHGIHTDRQTMMTSVEGVFAAGGAVGRGGKLAVRAVADGKAAAVCIGQYLGGHGIVGPVKPFTCHIGQVQEGEIATFLACASGEGRGEPSDASAGLSITEAVAQAKRCLRCDCRKAGGEQARPYPCKLRVYAEQYDAAPNRYKSGRRTFEQKHHPQVIYESGKCIDCGLCVQIVRQEGEPVGLAFVGRGFDVRVAVPFDRTLEEGLTRAARRCAEACPTGAISLVDE